MARGLALIALLALLVPYGYHESPIITVPLVGTYPVAREQYYDVPEPRIVNPVQVRFAPVRIYYEVPIARPIARPAYFWVQVAPPLK